MESPNQAGRFRMRNRLQALEIVTIRNGRDADVEVQFGWSIPHDAPEGEFVTIDHEEPTGIEIPGSGWGS
jgi:hypothetical protein